MVIFNIISKIIGHINQKIAAIGILTGVSVAFVNVIARYAFDASLVWATELTIYVFLWSVFFGAAYCFKQDKHIAVTILVDYVPTKVAKPMLILSHLVSLVFLSAVSFYGYKYITDVVMLLDERSIDLWNMPMWIIYLAIPVAFFFAAYRVAERIILIIRTPHDKIIKESEAEMVLSQMGEQGKNNENENVQNLNKMVKDTEKKTGGML